MSGFLRIAKAFVTHVRRDPSVLETDQLDFARRLTTRVMTCQAFGSQPEDSRYGSVAPQWKLDTHAAIAHSPTKDAA